MKVTIEIESENAPFSQNAADEVMRVLRDVGSRIGSFLNYPGMDVPSRGAVQDSNGNTMGRWEVRR